MAVKSEKQINAFIKGLITEASPLTFPPDASLDEDNFILNRDGSRHRRLGMEFESDYVLNSTGTSTLSPSTFHEWRLSGGDSDISIGVVRVYNKLWFLNMLDQSPSSALLNSGNSIEIALLGTAPISTTVINNALILVSESLPYPIRFTYDEATDVVTNTEYKVYVRDFWGVYDGLLDNERPTTLSLTHRYNLLNQGWSPTVQTSCVAPNDSEPIQCTYVKIGKYPSNSDLWSVGKVADSSSANYEKYDPATMVKNTHDFLHAPKGKHIIDVFDRGASRTAASSVTSTAATGTATGVVPSSLSILRFVNTASPTSGTAVADATLLPADKELGSFSTIASYAGRVWYSGVRTEIDSPDQNSPNYSGYVFFSQTVVNDEKIGRCYQEADPTSQDISDIIDSDGGAVHIIDAINIIALVPTKSMLLVFAENGVWQISGGEVNFAATDYDISKVSAIGCNSPQSIVAVNNEVFYFAKAGIFRIVVDSNDGGLKSENLSLTSIQTLYNNIPDKAKQTTRGVFEEKENTLRWLYNDSLTYQGETNYNRELILDLTLGAFYTNTIDNTTTYVADFVKIPDYSESQNSDEVLVGTAPVIVTDLSEVVVDVTSAVERDSPFSYLAIVPNHATGSVVEGSCDTASSAFITIAADPYSNQFFYNTVVDEVWRVVFGTTNYKFQRYDGTTGAYIADTAEVGTFWDEYDLAFVESTGRIYLTDGSGKVVILSATDGSLISSYSSDSYVLSVDPYTDTVWCGDYTEFSNLVKLNADGSRAATYPLDGLSASFLGGMTFSLNYVWVADYNNPKMYRVDKSTGSVTEYDTSAVLGAGAEVDHIAYDSVRDCIWAFDATNTLRKFSLATNTFTDSWTYTGTFLTQSTVTFNKHTSLYNSTIDKLVLFSEVSGKILLINPDTPLVFTELTETTSYDLHAYYMQDGCLFFWAADNIKKYCCIAASSTITYANKFTISKYRDTTFKDWTITTGGADYTSYLVTGYDIFGEMMRTKQVPYILFYFDRTEDGYSEVGGNLVLDNQSGCIVQAQWNWTNSANSGRWGTPFQAYRLNRHYIPSGPSDTFDYGDRVIVTKSRLRGSGKSLSLKISSESGKDMKLLGWAMVLTGDQRP